MLGVVSENMGGYWSSYWEDTPTTHSFDNKHVYSKGLLSSYCKFIFCSCSYELLKTLLLWPCLIQYWHFVWEKISCQAYYCHFKSCKFHQNRILLTCFSFHTALSNIPLNKCIVWRNWENEMSHTVQSM